MRVVLAVVFIVLLSLTVHAGFREKFLGECPNYCRGYFCYDCPAEVPDSSAQFRIRELISSESYPGFMPTVLTVGPDGAVYVAQANGVILKVNLTDVRTISSIEEIRTLEGRLILGLAFAPNSSWLYVSHSEGAFENASADSGAVSVLRGVSFAEKKLIIGLPRSAYDHATNGLAFGPDGLLYIGQSGMTNAGARGLGLPELYEQRAETPLSAAVLVADPKNGSVSVFASGLRNPVDLAFHNGKLFASENGGNIGWGPRPGSDVPPCSEPGGDILDMPDEINLIEEGKYYGHPNPSRDECGFSGESPLLNFSGTTSLTGIVSYQNGVFSEFRGRLLVLNFMQDRLYVVNSEERSIEKIGLVPYGRPLDIAVDDGGGIFMTWAGGTFGLKGKGPARLVVMEPVWSQRASLPEPRAEHAAVASNGKIYVVGGFLPEDLVTSGGSIEARRYDPVSDAWENIAPLPQGANHPRAVSVNGDVYVVGGLTSWRFNSTDKVFRYAEENESWVEVAPLPRPIGASGVAVIGRKIYSVGGIRNGASTNEAYVYDTVLKKWKELPPLHIPRDHVAAAAVDGKVYAIGGRTYPDTGVHPIYNTAAFEVYNPETDGWTELPDLPTPRSGLSAAVVGKKIYVFGGEGQHMMFSSVEVYDTLNGSWSSLERMPAPRHGTQAAVIGNMIHLPGGGMHSGGFPNVYHDVFFAGETNGTIFVKVRSAPPVVHEERPMGNLEKALLGISAAGVLALIFLSVLLASHVLLRKRKKR